MRKLKMGSNRMGHICITISVLLQLLNSAWSQPYIGINYGELADNLPPPSATATLLRSTTIANIRLYGVNAPLIQSLSNTNIAIIISTSNSDIPLLASDPSAAANWVATNVLPYVPAAKISTVTVGNEVLYSGDVELANQLLPAMENLNMAVKDEGLDVKISTVHAMSALGQSDPPSAGRFDPAVEERLKPVLAFLRSTGSPFMINPYPYFAYQSDPRPETLAFCLFQSNPGRLDSGSQKTYTNMFDAQVDAVRSALAATGFGDLEVVVAETGWPYRGDADENGATLENAKAYNGNLVAHLKGMSENHVVTYLFALYDEDLKPGKLSERSFGIYRTDLNPIYDIGLNKASQSQTLPSPTAPLVKPKGGLHDCNPKAAASTQQLNTSVIHVCVDDTNPMVPVASRHPLNTNIDLFIVCVWFLFVSCLLLW